MGLDCSGEKVSVKMAGNMAKTTTGKDGRWLLQLPSLKAGSPYTMQVDATNHITLREVLIGDIWLCSGQRNRVHQMGIHNVRYEAAIATANYQQIRQFWVQTIATIQGPQQDLLSGNRAWANPTDAL